MLALLDLAIIGWLPGAVFFRLPVLQRDRRAALDAEERLFWAVVLSATTSLIIVLVLAAAHRYTFERLLVGDVAVAGVLAGAARLRLRLGAAARGPRWTVLIPVALLLLGWWRFFPSDEYVMGGRDPGTYMNEGIQIAQRGTLVVHDPVIASVPNFARDLFFPSHHNSTYYGLRFMGFFIKNPDTGEVVGQFPHLFPASIAIGYGIAGLSGARWTVGIWALLGLVSVYFAGARLLGRAPAAAAAALLALNVIDVWFARYPNAEMVMQALLFAALLANARAHVDEDAFFAPVAGVVLALLLFLRIDMLLAVVTVLAGQAWLFLGGRRTRWTFSLPLVAGGGLYGWYLFGAMRAYVEMPFGFLITLFWWQYGLILIAVAAGVAVLVLPSWKPALAAKTMREVPTILAGVVVLLALYALIWRAPGGRLAAHDAYALRTFAAFYLTIAGLLAALVGYVLVARGRFLRDPALMATVTGFSLFFFYKIRIVPDHFWMARRFLPVILPGCLLFIGAAALMGSRGRWRGARAVRTLIGVVFLVVLAGQYARAARPIIDHVEYAGIIPRLEALVSKIGDDDLVIVESRNASDLHVLAVPMAYIYARSVLVLSSPVPDRVAFAAFLDWAQTKYHRVLFMGGGGTDLLSSKWTVTPIDSERFQVPEYDEPLNAYPTSVRHKEFDFSLYTFGKPRRDPGLWFDLDVGVRDDLNVLRFHAKEQTEHTTFRWSRDRSYVMVTEVHPTSRIATIWMNDGGRPPAAPPADVRVSLDGHPLGTAHVTSGFHPYTFEIVPSVAAAAASSGEPVRLMIETPVWNPHLVLGTPDDRDLGVMVDRVAVR